MKPGDVCEENPGETGRIISSRTSSGSPSEWPGLVIPTYPQPCLRSVCALEVWQASPHLLIPACICFWKIRKWAVQAWRLPRKTEHVSFSKAAASVSWGAGVWALLMSSIGYIETPFRGALGTFAGCPEQTLQGSCVPDVISEAPVPVISKAGSWTQPPFCQSLSWCPSPEICVSKLMSMSVWDGDSTVLNP